MYNSPRQAHIKRTRELLCDESDTLDKQNDKQLKLLVSPPHYSENRPALKDPQLGGLTSVTASEEE